MVCFSFVPAGSIRSNLLEDFISPESIILKIRIAPAEVSSAPAPRRDRCRDGFSGRLRLTFWVKGQSPTAESRH